MKIATFHYKGTLYDQFSLLMKNDQENVYANKNTAMNKNDQLPAKPLISGNLIPLINSFL